MSLDTGTVAVLILDGRWSHCIGLHCIGLLHRVHQRKLYNYFQIKSCFYPDSLFLLYIIDIIILVSTGVYRYILVYFFNHLHYSIVFLCTYGWFKGSIHTYAKLKYVDFTKMILFSTYGHFHSLITGTHSHKVSFFCNLAKFN